MGPNQLRYVVSGGFLLAAILVAVGTYFAPPSLFEAIQRNDIAEAIELANDQAATLLAEEKAGKVEVGLRERGYVWGGPPSTWTGRLARIGRGRLKEHESKRCDHITDLSLVYFRLMTCS